VQPHLGSPGFGKTTGNREILLDDFFALNPAGQLIGPLFVSKKPACKSLDDIFAGRFIALLFETRSQQRFRMHVVLKVGSWQFG
jgi:hypothetical protein